MKLAWTLALCTGPVLMTPLASARPQPDFGLMFNDDGDLSFSSPDPVCAMANLQAHIHALAGTPVKTLMYCVGTDVVYYPSQATSVWGWRKTKYDTVYDNPQNEDQMWAERIKNIKTGMDAGHDPIRVAGQTAKTLGMYFVPSYRMNDDHFIFDPFEYPLTGAFWLENHEQMTIKDSPILSDDHYGNLLDFTHEAVRQYRLDILFEMIDRYGDLMDGLEMDFNRSQVLFPRGQGPKQAHLITAMVEFSWSR